MLSHIFSVFVLQIYLTKSIALSKTVSSQSEVQDLLLIFQNFQDTHVKNLLRQPFCIIVHLMRKNTSWYLFANNNLFGCKVSHMTNESPSTHTIEIKTSCIYINMGNEKRKLLITKIFVHEQYADKILNCFILVVIYSLSSCFSDVKC